MTANRVRCGRCYAETCPASCRHHCHQAPTAGPRVSLALALLAFALLAAFLAGAGHAFLASVTVLGAIASTTRTLRQEIHP